MASKLLSCAFVALAIFISAALAAEDTPHGSYTTRRRAVSARGLLQAPVSEDMPTATPSSSSGACVVINEVVHKPEDIGEMKGMDFVELYNPCDAEVDLTGWSLSDEDDTEFVMGQDGCSHVVGAGEFLVLFRNNPCSFEFGYTGVDKATLKDAQGGVVQVVEWGRENADKGRSWSAIPDGSSDFQDGRPTPGVANEAFIE